ncbi:MAG: hypothetical protein ACP5PZ_12310 [Bacteroidales bacterium]
MLNITKFFKTIILFSQISVCLYSQQYTKQTIRSEYIKQLLSFYAIFYKSDHNLYHVVDTEYFNIKEEVILSYRKELTQDLSYNEIIEIINNLEEFYDGDIWDRYVQLRFKDNKRIFFVFEENDFGIFLTDRIYLSDGYSLISYPINVWTSEGIIINKGYKRWKLLFRGIINDNISTYVEIHEKPDNNSRSVRKIYANFVFYFSPYEVNKDWYEVYNENIDFIGYIQKNKVVTFDNFPKWLKEKIWKRLC